MEDHGILNIRFNAASDCFAVAMQSGIRIYNLDPLVKLAQIEASQIGSVYLVEMLNRSNYIGFVSGGKKPKYAENAVILYDLVAKMPSFEYMVPLPVVAFRLCHSFVVVLTLSEVYVFYLADPPSVLYKCPTADNPQGVCDVTCAREFPPICVFPAPRTGALHLLELEECTHSRHMGAGFTPTVIPASESAVAAVTLSYDGRFLAASSIRGTLIRLWSLSDRQRPPPLLVEFRRGAEAAKILSLAFAPLATGSNVLLVAASDTGTAHVFVYNLPNAEVTGPNGSPRTVQRQRHSILSAAARVVAAATATGSGTSSGALSPSSLHVSQLLDACRFSVGPSAARAVRLVSNSRAVALSPDGRLQRFAIIPSDEIARSDIIDSFIDLFEDI